MRTTYRVIYWSSKIFKSFSDDQKDTSDSHLSGSASWSSTIEPSKFSVENVLYPFDEYNVGLNREFTRIAKETEPFSATVLRFLGWTRLGACGLLVHESHRSILIGDIIGWGVDFAKWYTERELQAHWADDLSEVTFDIEKFSRVVMTGTSCCLAAPGQDIYGHWLLDYIPRILSTTSALDEHMPLRIRNDRSWINDILKILSVQHKCYDFKSNEIRIQFDHLLVPSFQKRGYIIDIPSCSAAWLELRSRIRGRLSENANKCEKIFVSRSRLGGTRPISNALEVETLASSLGYLVIYPEEMTVLEQANVFQNARIVVGQDGSGLHNIIFSDRIAALGVIGSLERVNFWHASICAALKSRVLFLSPIATREGAEVPILAFQNMLKYLADNV